MAKHQLHCSPLKIQAFNQFPTFRGTFGGIPERRGPGADVSLRLAGSPTNFLGIFLLAATRIAAKLLHKRMSRIYSLGEVARLLGVQGYRIAYAITTGQVPEATFKFLGKRCFTDEDIGRVAQHFGVTKSDSDTKGGACATAAPPATEA
jgi:hypothetical protein